MKNRSLTYDARIAPGSTSKPRFLDKLAKHTLVKNLADLRDGQIILMDGGKQLRFGQLSDRCSLSVSIEVKDAAFYSDIVFGGSIGAGEAYMADYWSCSDITALVRILCCNRQLLDGIDGGFAAVTVPIQKLLHWLNRNTQHGSRRNIAAHYDLGNDFFALMLDESMMYSSAIFAQADMSLAAAQTHRLEQMCQKLDLQASDHLLEIGSGWGGLALYAARNYGCRITTTTISQAQYDYTCARVRDAGLEHQIEVLLTDYRDLRGQYDKLVSIEMIEAVGHQYYETFFKCCSNLLKDDGVMLLQAITIADQRYESARKSVDFIQRYIFPGSCIPSVTRMLQAITSASNMRLLDLEDIGLHYATTLHKWRENVFQRKDEIRALGFNNEFLRMWEFYLCYCEGGFAERAISDVHMLLAKPGYRKY